MGNLQRHDDSPTTCGRRLPDLRGRMMWRAGQLLLIALVLALAGCSTATRAEYHAEDSPIAAPSTQAPSGSGTDVVPVESGSPDPEAEARYTVIGDSLTTADGAVIRLAYQPHDGLGGSLVPWVVPDERRSVIYYTTWLDREEGDWAELAEGTIAGVPVIRVVDTSTGNDEVFRTGAYAPAVSSDGRVGYVRDQDGAYRYSAPNPTRVVVATGSGVDEVWSSDGDPHYVTAAWAGDVLLVYRDDEDGHVLLAFDGPSSSRVLGINGDIGAISPDGSEILLVQPGDGDKGSRFATVDVATGKTLASFEGDQLVGMYGGDWLGDTIVVPTNDGIAVFTSRGDLALEQVLRPQLEGHVATYPVRLVSETQAWVRLTILQHDVYSYVEAICTLGATSACSSITDPLNPKQTVFVDNPSRGEEQ